MTPDPRTPVHVAMLVESSAGFAVGMFGAWAAGLGILPLPIDFPDERLRTMVADCGPRAVLASAALAARARELVANLHPPVPVVVLDDVVSGPPATPPADPPPDAPAYTVYTSGSTGRPKGVLIRHDQLGPLIGWSALTWALGSWVRMAQTLSLGFDFGLQELFTALPCGGTVVIPSKADRRDARSYAHFLRRERVTVLFSTPSYADELIAANVPLPDLRLVLLGGEVLRRHTVVGLRSLVIPEARIFNGYGPTEATVNCLMYEVPPNPEATVIPVGRASAAVRIHLVDQDDLPVPLGAIGQILIGGPGVADGYLHQPDISAERFTPDPVLGDGAVYRSGDLAYVPPGGEFVVIGRNDRQTKVRGFRIELDEVESVLRSAPGVDTAVVRILGEPRRLVTFLVGQDIRLPDVTAYAADRLPPAVLPEQHVVLDRLPMTANGKLDEHALRRAAEAGLTVLDDSASPAEIEAAVCRVWAHALAVPVVRPDANVFDLGAHSLIATRVHLQLQAALGVTFPIHDLFDHPCPRDLARRLAPRRKSDTRAHAISHATSEGVITA